MSQVDDFNKIVLSVVIINYKTPQLVIDCLESLLPELRSLDVKVVVVDNASNDGSYDLIQNWIGKQADSKQIELVASVGNTGFSGGNNHGISHVNADYYLLLNSDTLVRKGAISVLLNAASKDKTVGLVSPRLEWPDTTPQESCFRFHTPISELISSANTGPITQLFQNFNVPYVVSDKAGFYDWTSFACVLIKADVFKDIGLMDDGYFMYFEDVAFAYHAQLAGWKVLNVPEAHVVHLRGGSSPVKSRAKQRKRLPRYYYESRARYFYQVHGWGGLLLANTCWTLGYGVSLLRMQLSSSLSPLHLHTNGETFGLIFLTLLNLIFTLRIMTKPDFIIIGAMKSATTTLHTQLALQSGIFMTTLKEPNYFSDDTEYEKGEQWYSALFDGAEANDLCGESSTHYTKLPDYPLTIERMAKQLRNPKFIYMMRHPVDRLISHYIHQWSQNVIKCDINEAIDKYEELIDYSCYARQLEPYFKQFDCDNILPVFSEVIRQEPQKQLEKVASFIGYKEKVEWRYDTYEQNVSSMRIREFPGYDWIVKSDLMTSLRRTLIPKSIRNKIKGQLTMQDRPIIDEVHLSQLIAIFDKELSKVGSLLGVDLSCNNYHAVVGSQDLNWNNGNGE